jgi:hypothetical protein
LHTNVTNGTKTNLASQLLGAKGSTHSASLTCTTHYSKHGGASSTDLAKAVQCTDTVEGVLSCLSSETVATTEPEQRRLLHN